MEYLDKIKIISKKSKLRQDADKIISELPNNKIVTDEILDYLGNKTTKLVEDNDIKNNYYVFFYDTIYLNTKHNNKFGRICVIAHECIHSIQSKILQKINFILSNLEILFFIISLVLDIFFKDYNFIFFIYLVIVLASITVRLILEIDAVRRSVILSDEYLNGRIETEKKKIIIDIYKFQTSFLLPLFLINLVFFKLLRLMLIYILYYIF